MVYEVSDSKAIFGAAFLHYLAYCVFYSIDAIKMAESDDPDKESDDPRVRKAKQRAQEKKNDPRAGGTNNPTASPTPGGGNGVQMNDIKLEEGKDAEEKKTGQPSSTGPGPRPRKPAEDDDEDQEDLDGYDDEGAPFFTQIVNRFPKTMCWYFMIM